MRYDTRKWTMGGDREFYFPGEVGCRLVIGAYLREGSRRERPVVWLGGSDPRAAVLDMNHRYIPAPPEAIRHAAATGDPTLLIDWLLENACDDRPWLAEALRAAVVGAA